MLKTLRRMFSVGTVTTDFPTVIAEPPEGFLGKPVIDFERCDEPYRCAAACPTGAIRVRKDASALPQDGGTILTVDYGDCIFCGQCAEACPNFVSMSKEFQLAVTKKEDLVTEARYGEGGRGKHKFQGYVNIADSPSRCVEDVGGRLQERIHSLLGRSLHIREVDAGSCNGCEIEITALNNPIHDLERFGIHFVASPRHADMLLVTGPVTRNMEIALKHTYDAAPEPRIVVAVGACAIGGGIFGTSYASNGGADTAVPVDVYIPGCPPRPEALLHGILLAIGRMSQQLKRVSGSSSS